jgi:peptidoglycan/xylan/chitin deacetylase (PgdA/CDA1 family)
MPAKVVCILTFDYEISLGRNFLPPDKVLFEPTAQVLEICDRLSVPATFFPDICSVWAYRDAGLNDYADKFEAQMKRALAAGHDVQLHLHPHWLNSTFVNGEWLISTDKMYLHELGFCGENSAGDLIQRGIKYLNDLLSPVSPQYKCIAFRAAGLALQPNEKEIITALRDNGILVDASITKGLKMKIDTICNDYRRVPRRANWFLSEELGIEAEAPDGILEFPVISFQSGLLTQMGFLKRRIMSVGQIRGTTISRAKRQSRLANIRTMALQNLRYVTGRPWFLLSFDTKGFDLRMLVDGLSDYISRHSDDQVIIGCVMSHPKLMFDTQMTLMSDFIQECRRKFDITFDSCTESYQAYRSGRLQTDNSANRK